MSDAKRAAALITCIGMILVLFTSSAYIAHEAGHICVGEECEVCERIEEVKAMLHGFALAIVAVLLVLAVLSLHRALHTMEGLCLHAPCTLVSWKVRLNN